MAESKEEIPITFYTFGKTEVTTNKVVVSKEEVQEIYALFNELAGEITSVSSIRDTEVLEQELLELVEEYQLLPQSLSKGDMISLTNPPWRNNFQKNGVPSRFHPFSVALNDRGSAFFCNFATIGSGSQFPGETGI